MMQTVTSSCDASFKSQMTTTMTYLMTLHTFIFVLRNVTHFVESDNLVRLISTRYVAALWRHREQTTAQQREQQQQLQQQQQQRLPIDEEGECSDCTPRIVKTGIHFDANSSETVVGWAALTNRFETIPHSGHVPRSVKKTGGRGSIPGFRRTRLTSCEKPGKRRFGQMLPRSGTEASAQKCVDKYSQESEGIRLGSRDDVDGRREH